MLKLTQSQKEGLKAELKKAVETFKRNRACVILGRDKGLTIDQLAKVLCLSHATICNYLKDYRAEEKIQNEPEEGAKVN